MVRPSYKIDKDGFCYDHSNNTIGIGFPKFIKYENLTDNELLEFTADVITHEFLHYLLEKEFNSIVSKLFDVVGDFLYVHTKIRSKAVDKKYMWTYLIDHSGYDTFLWYKNLNAKGVKIILDKMTPKVYKGVKTNS